MVAPMPRAPPTINATWPANFILIPPVDLHDSLGAAFISVEHGSGSWDGRSKKPTEREYIAKRLEAESEAWLCKRVVRSKIGRIGG
jgi:hypothetical protein